MHDADRQTGRTTQQMKDAPYGAVFVWPVGNSISYAKDLAHKLGRGDLRIVSMSALSDCSLYGLHVPAIVLDHETMSGMKPNDYGQFMRLGAQIVRPPVN